MKTSSLLCRMVAVVFGFGVMAAAGQGRGSVRPQAAAAGKYLITGTVINSVDQSPVPYCRMTVAPFARRGFAGNRQFVRGNPMQGNSDDVACDEHGHFSVPVPSAGAWRLSASARGFVTQAYEEHESTFSTAIVLSPAKPTIDLRFEIGPQAVIAGVVLDEAGEPVRNAQVSLHTVAAGAESGVARSGLRSTAQTDDRGRYELANIAPGRYRVLVQAQPWYATQARAQSNGAVSVDPPLDFSYAATWFPGTDDMNQAEPIVLQAGETRQADFNLTPVPSAHLRIAVPIPTNGGRPVTVFPIVQPLIPGITNPISMQVARPGDVQGQMEFSGLAPGRYRISMAGPGQDRGPTILEVKQGAVQVLDLNSRTNGVKVTIQFDGLGKGGGDSRLPGVNFVDTAGGGEGWLFGGGFGGPGGSGFRRGSVGREDERTMEMSPGRYEVVLQGRPDLYLTGITAKGAEAAGRYVTLAAGSATLTLHVANGRASLAGVAMFRGKPAEGAMVLLAPTTIEDPNSILIPRREQTNTDGGFELDDVLPGQYILVVIDHGWHVNWNDASTLRGYLTQGVPLELMAGENVKQNVDAQAP